MRISKLVSELQRTGWVRPNDWSIDLSTPNFSDLFGDLGAVDSIPHINERVVRFGIPASLNIITAETRSNYGIPKTVGTERSRGGEVTITFRVDADMKIIDFFRNWQSLVVPELNGTANTATVGYYDDYASGTIRYTNEKSNAKFILMEAFPISISEMQATHEPNNSIITVDVSFVYRRVDRP